MGISGLLPLLKQIQEPTTLARYRGKTLAIDTYAWLHRSILGCGMELAQDIPTTKYTNYILKRIDMLHHFGITPYLVFDGDYLPCKSGTEVERERRRDEYKRQGLLLLARGDSKTAFSCFQKSCDITPLMAKLLIDILRRRNIKYVVAPYEADSQMVYLEKSGIVDGIISEDSDLLIFGCNKLITKLNDKGECIEISRDNFKNCRQVPIQFMSQEQLRMVATLSGCDYTKGIPGIGVIKAFSLVAKYKRMDKVLNAIRLESKYKVPESFEEEFEKANFAFQFQLVFDPRSNKPIRLSEAPEDASLMLRTVSGEKLDDEIHQKIAIGDLHPVEKTHLVSREALLLGGGGNGVAVLRSSSWQSSKTPHKTLAARAYSTPTTSVASRRTIDTFFTATKSVKYQTPISEVKTCGKRTLASSEKKSISPVSKRKRILQGAEVSKVGQVKSKFFKGLEQKNQESSVSEFHSSDFEIEELSDEEEKPVQNKVATSSDEENKTSLGLRKHVLSSSDTEDISEVESPVASKRTMSLKERFAFQSGRRKPEMGSSPIKLNTDAKRLKKTQPLQESSPSRLNIDKRWGGEKSQVLQESSPSRLNIDKRWGGEKSQVLQESSPSRLNIDEKLRVVKKGSGINIRSLNLDRFIYTEQ